MTAFCLSLILLLPNAHIVYQREDVLVAKIFKGRGRTTPDRLFVPKNYTAHRTYPLVLFLHGGGGSGVDNLKQIQGGNGFMIDLLTKSESQARFPCFVVAPQSPQQEGWIERDSVT